MRYLRKGLVAALSILCFNISAFSQTVSVKLENVTVKEAMTKVKRQTGYNIILPSEFDLQTKVNINVHKGEINSLVEQLLADHKNLTFDVKGENIIVYDKNLKNGPLVQINGIIYDKAGYPIIGAGILAVGSNEGCITDADGKFSMSVPSNSQLEISCIGYNTIYAQAESGKTLKFILEEDSEMLQETVVIGYGTQLKKNLSSSISKVDNDALQNASAPSFESLLQGRAAGVAVTTGSALGGSGVSIRIRGTSSASGSSEPLYVIDGVPMETASINEKTIGASVGNWDLQTASVTNVLASINPNDIESLEILKDAAAAAVYGSRGANGVILITTKRGKAGKTSVSATADWGVSTATNRPPLLNSEQYIELAQEAWTNSGNNLADFWEKSGVLKDGLTKEQAMATETDWVDETLRTGFSQNYNVSISGGNEKLNYYLSGGLKDDKTIMIGNHYQKFTARTNVESQLNKIFRVGTNMFFTHTNDDQSPISWNGGVGKVTFMLPIWPVYKEDGSYFNISGEHPVASVNLRKIKMVSNQFVGNWFLKANIVDGLSFRTDVGINMIVNDDSHYKGKELSWKNKATAGSIQGRRFSWNWKNVLNYSKIIKDHNIDVVLAHEMQHNQYRSNTFIGEGFFNSAMTEPNDAATKLAYQRINEYAFMSFIGRFNYSYRDTYLLSLSMRADGSSRFAPANRWGYFPAVSAGYTMSNERFFDNIRDKFNLLKIRASYGIVGNAEIGDYLFYDSYRTGSYNGQTSIITSNIGDPQLGWEQTAQLDLGIDMEFLKGRIALTFDWYDKKTSNLLIPYPVSSLTGVDRITRNIGQLKNTGFEFTINTVNIRNKDFEWTTNLNLAHNTNKVTQLMEKELSSSTGFGSNTLMVGYPIGTVLRPVWAGVDPATGEDTYLEKDGTKLLCSETIAKYGSFKNFAEANKVPTGNPFPVLAGGFSNSLTYKNWTLDVLFTFATGMDFDMGIQRRSLAPFGSTKYNAYTNLLDRWQKPGDHASVSKLTTENVEWTGTTETLHRTDYLRLKDVTLTYRIPIRSKAIRNISCYVKGTNLATITKAPNYYWDPEFTLNDTSMNAGSADATAPQALSVLMGIKFDF